MNFCTALLSAGAAALLHASVQLRTGCSAAGAAAAALFALAPLQWSFSVQADVFGLSNFLSATILLAVTHNFQQRSLAASMLTALVCGLSLTNQHTCIFLVFPVALAVLVAGDTCTARMSGARRLLAAVLRVLLLLMCGVVGLLPYLYLPIAARAGALVSWGDCTTLKGFIRHITRAEYGARLWCPFGGDTYCIATQLFANQRAQTLSSALLSVSRSAAAWATSLHVESCHMMLPLLAAALAAHSLPLFQALLRVKQASSWRSDQRGPEDWRWVDGVVGGGVVDGVLWAALLLYLAVFHALASIPPEVPLTSCPPHPPPLWCIVPPVLLQHSLASLRALLLPSNSPAPSSHAQPPSCFICEGPLVSRLWSRGRLLNETVLLS
jgi:hypothetical protein